MELHAETLLIDDRDGVLAAMASGVNLIRTPGIYRLAKERGIIPAVRPKLDELRKAGFWLRYPSPITPASVFAVRTDRRIPCASASAAATPSTLRSACRSPMDIANTVSPSNDVLTG